MTIQGNYSQPVGSAGFSVSVQPYTPGLLFTFEAWITRVYFFGFIQAVTTNVPRVCNTISLNLSTSGDPIHQSINNNMAMNVATDVPQGLVVGSQAGNMCDVRFPIGELRALPNQTYVALFSCLDNFQAGEQFTLSWIFEYQPSSRKISQ